MVSHRPPEHAVRNLPIREVTLAALRYTSNNFSALTRIAMFPLLLSTLLTVLSVQALTSPGLYLILYLLTYVPHTLFAVAWHRRTLLQTEEISTPSVPAWQSRHWLFLFRTFLLLIIFYGILIFGSIPVGFLSAILPLVAPFLILALLLGAGYVVARLSFVLPATAVEESYSLDNSWQQTKNQGVRLISAYLLMTLPFILLYLLISPLIFDGLMSGKPQLPEITEQLTIMDLLQPYINYLQINAVGYTFAQIILLALSYFPIAAIITLLSFAFQACTGWVPEDIEKEGDNHDDNITE
ncbi:hypothetical protein [Kiloniella antarctica]|uniref:Glycerophosphoryl diester phosphodiesterase membrane domain-containing protein n=1 Tax=Kiloniella antarctica TaxID=1550907 RepID=A0ABW5BGL2_9PROT